MSRPPGCAESWRFNQALMSAYIKIAKTLLAMAAIGAMMVACRVTIDRPSDPEVAEVMHEIDIYRNSGGPGQLTETESEDPTYLATGDRLTTAAVQFPGRICRIQLSDVLLTTLRNNRSIRIQEYERNIAEEGVVAAKGIYDLLLSASWQYTKNNSQTPVVADPPSARNRLAESRSRMWDLELAIEQLLPTGGAVGLSLERGFRKMYPANEGDGLGQSIDPYDTVAGTVFFSQPLLKGLGPAVTNAPIHIAQIGQDIAREDFRNTVIDELASAIKLYWDLVFTINNYEVQLLSLERAQELLRIAIIKRDTGVEPPNVVLQAQAEVSSREASVIDARRAIADAADALKRVMNMSEASEQWNANLIPVDRPTFTPVNLNEQAVYSEALRFRPDYRNAQYALEIARINHLVAKNNKLPQLDINGSYSITGMEDSFSGAVDSAETADYETWSGGLSFYYPLQNRAAKAGYRSAGMEIDKSEETLRNLAEVIRLEVRTAIRALETNLKLIRAYEATVRSEKAKLDSQLKRYEVGFSTIFEVLDFQEDLANAQVKYLESVVNYNKSVIELQRIKASFLQDYRIQVLQQGAVENDRVTIVP